MSWYSHHRGSLSVNSFFFWRHQCKYQFVSDGACQPEISFLYVRVAWEILRRVYWLLSFACLSNYSKTTNCYVFLAWNAFRFTPEWITVTVFASSIYESLGDSITVCELWYQKKDFLQFRIFAITVSMLITEYVTSSWYWHFLRDEYEHCWHAVEPQTQSCYCSTKDVLHAVSDWNLRAETIKCP